MVSVYDIKPVFQRFLRPALPLLSKFRATPNKVTVIALLGSIFAGLLVLLSARNISWLLVLPMWLFVRMALNALDGMMARVYGLRSNLGAILNELGDVISDLAIFLPLAFVFKDAFLAVMTFSIGAVMTEFCGILGQALGASRRYEGPMGKSDRAFFVGVLAVLTVLFPNLIAYWKWIFWLAFFLTILTCWNRISFALKELKI